MFYQTLHIACQLKSFFFLWYLNVVVFLIMGNPPVALYLCSVYTERKCIKNNNTSKKNDKTFKYSLLFVCPYYWERRFDYKSNKFLVLMKAKEYIIVLSSSTTRSINSLHSVTRWLFWFVNKIPIFMQCLRKDICIAESYNLYNVLGLQYKYIIMNKWTMHAIAAFTRLIWTLMSSPITT